MIFSPEEFDKLKQLIKSLKEKRERLNKEKEVFSYSGSYLARTPGYLEHQAEILDNERELAILEGELAQGEIVDILEKLPSEVITIYSQVFLEDLDAGQGSKYWIKNLPQEKGEEEGILEISIKSPLARALLGHKVGEEIYLPLPRKSLRVKIKSIIKRM